MEAKYNLGLVQTFDMAGNLDISFAGKFLKSDCSPMVLFVIVENLMPLDDNAK